MAASYVTVTLDRYDGAGNPVVRGTATFTPSLEFPDVPDEMLVGMAPVAVAFNAPGLPPVRLLANDSAGPQQGNGTPGWTWNVTYDGVPGNPPDASYYVLSANGSAQRLSELASVPAAQPGTQYLPLPSTPPGSASEVLGLSSVSPMVTEWVDQSGGKIPLASSAYVDLCTAWSNGSPVAAVTPAVPLVVTFSGLSTTATVTSGTAPASGAIISDYLPAGTTYTASGSTLTLSAAAQDTGSTRAWAGQDATPALQAAINYFNTQGTDGTIEFSEPGSYLVNGPQQSGTSNGRAYTGQLLFPHGSISSTSSLMSVRFKGSGPYAGFYGGGIEENSGGVILLCAPGTGNVFDAIASAGTSTGTVPVFEDITIRCPSNPQCAAAVNGTAFAGLVFRGSCNVDTISPGNPNDLTGSGYGIRWPGQDNMAMLHQAGELNITGYPFGMSLGEHLLMDYVAIQACGTAVEAVEASHPAKIAYCCLQACNYGIAPAAGAVDPHLSGMFDVGDDPPLAFLNDPTNLLYGDIQVAPTTYALNEVPGLGWPSNGGNNVVIRNYTRPPSVWPSETFGRVNETLPATYQYGPGATDQTGHVWTAAGSCVFPSAGGMQSGVSGSAMSSLLKYNAGRANPSRVVRAKLVTGTSCNFYVILGQLLTGNATLYVQLAGGNLNIQKVIGATATTLATAAGVTASTAYTLDVYVSNPYSAAGAFTVTAFLNGTQMATWTMGASDAGGNSITQLTDTEQFFTQDGIGLYADTSTLLTEFAVIPAGDAMQQLADYAPAGLTGATAASRYVGGTAGGAPASGSFLKGDFVIDQTANVWVCTAAGSPGTWGPLAGDATSIDGVTVTGAAVAGNVITATSPTAANWQTPAGGVTLDTTAADIKPGGIQAAGGVGKASDSGHVHPENSGWIPSDNGLLAWNFDPALITASLAGAFANVYAVRVNLRAAATVTNVVLALTGNGASLTSGQNIAGLYTSAGVQVGVTGDQTTAWGSGAPKLIAAALSGGPYNLAAGSYYVLFLANGTGTVPGFGRSAPVFNAAMSNLGLAAGSYRWGVGAAAQTALPASFTPSTYLSAATDQWWAALS